jgi:hypothetical protein
MAVSPREQSSVTPSETEPARQSSPAAEPSGEETDEASSDLGLPASESTNVWPDEAAEAAFLAETRGTAQSVAFQREGPVREEATTAPLPKLDELVNRIPAESRELLEELFRAKFTTVRRINQSDLKV